MQKFLSLVFIPLWMTIAINSYSQEQTLNHATEKAIESAIPEILKDLSIPGLSVAISRDGKLLYSNGFGYSDVKKKLKADSQTLYRMASVSKLLAATAIAKLMQDGKINIREPVETYLDDYPHEGKGITTQLLLSHQAGIRHYSKGDMVNNLKDFGSTEEALKIFVDDPLEFEPGTSYKYSTYAFTLIQALVEATSKETYLEYLQNHIFDPLDMNRSFPDKKRPEYENHSKLYRVKKRGGNTLSIFDNPSYKWGGGGMLSNVEDLVKLGEAHMNSGFFMASTLDTIFSPVVEMPGTLDPTKIGMAWRISKDLTGQPIYHHAGNMNGARSVLLLSPHDRTVIAVMSNNRQLDFIEHFAISMKDNLIHQMNLNIKPNGIFVIHDVNTGDIKGNISIQNRTPYFPATITLDELFGADPELHLVSGISKNGITLRNLKVTQQVLSASLKLVNNSNDGNLVIYHKNEDGSWSKKEYIAKYEK